VIFLVVVIPHPDEADLVDSATVAAAREWLAYEETLGVITYIRAFRKTGGFMLVEAKDEEALRAWLAPYPLLDTIKALIFEDVVDLDDGFAVLEAAVAEREQRPKPTFADLMDKFNVEQLRRRVQP
jgi:hypothetical protein